LAGVKLKKEGREIAFLFLLAAAYFLPVLINGNSRVISAEGGDTWSAYFNWRHFGFASLVRGEIPLWNPYSFSGTPFVAGIQSALFYPLNVLYLFFDTPFAINLSVTIHCLLGSLFTYLFARYIDIGRPGAVLAALTFTYGAPYFFHIYPGHLTLLCTMIWLPLVMMWLETVIRTKQIRYAVWSGVVLSLQVFAGNPQYLFYSTIAVSGYLFLRVILGKDWDVVPYSLAGYGIFAATGILLSMIQLLPTLELISYSVRERLTYEWVSAFSLPPEELVTLLLPNFFGDMVQIPYWGKNYLWEMSLYLGIVPFVMCVIAVALNRARHVFVFSIIAGVSLLFALGKYTPVLTFLYNYVPGFDRFRGISKFVFVFSFAISMIAGYGLHKLTVLAEERSPKLRSISYAILASALVLFCIGAVGWLFGEDVWRSIVEASVTGPDRYDPPPDLTELFLSASMKVALWDILKVCFVLLLLGGSLFVFPKLKKLKVESLMMVVLALTAGDLAHFGSRYVTTFDPRRLYMDEELKAFLKSDQEPFRIATPIVHLLNQGLLEHIENAGGYDAIVLKNYNEFINFAQQLPIDEPNLAMRLRTISPALNLLNVKYYILESGMRIDGPTVDLVFRGRKYDVYRNRDAYPRAFVVHDVRIINDRDAAFRLIASAESAPKSFAIVEEPIGAVPHHGSVQSPLPKIVEYRLNRVSIQADLKEQGFLVLADSYYPGWKAFVDGKKTKIYRTNYVMRGVVVPAGLHRVEFRYDPLSFKIGLIISLTSLVVVVGFLMWCRSRID
jgi:hypothetical protein